MIIYKDRISGDEMLSDVFTVKEVDDCYYEVRAKQVTESTTVDDSMFGGNASAEGGDEGGAEDSSVSGIDIALQHRLQRTEFNKKSFGTYIKGYSKDLVAILEKEDPDRVEKFKAGMPKLVKKILGSFKDWDFYTGESQNPDGMVALLNWHEAEGEESYPYMIFFKDAMLVEKV